MESVIRPADPADIPTMVTLRGHLFHDLAASGSATHPEAVRDTTWQQTCAEIIQQQLAHPDHHYTVATPPDGAVLGWGHAILIHQLPGPGFPTGLMGQISSVITASEHRGHGVGAAVTSSLLRWLTGQGAEVVDLLASGSALGLYRRLGFTEPHSTALRYVP